ncbi:hypothetical protein BKI52_07795 [marine bacterium AO1-C]|nr:hypothetical protein BKI52_07795 [marine bacterium AO1-C]
MKIEINPMEKASLVTEVIRNRRTIFADAFTSEEVSQELIEQVLTDAIWAPTHKRTEPWRFVVLKGNHPEKMGEYMAEFYKDYILEKRYNSLKQYCKNATLIAIIMHRDERERIPEWEELAAVSCAVQNLWLSCTTHGLGGYWETCEAAMEYTKQFTQAGERSMGIFMLGHYDAVTTKAVSRRRPLEEKLHWDFGDELTD